MATEKVQYLDAALGTKYRATRSRLVEFFQNRSVVGIDREQVAEFVAWYRALVSPGVLKERLTLIRACWQWALEQKYVEINPWNNRVKVPAKERPEPFTEDEVRRILQVFQEVPRFQHYRDFVEFVLTTGCRTGEAAALTWSGVRKQESQIVFFASKTNKIRVVEIPSELTEMLRHRRLDWGETDATSRRWHERVFTSVRGRPINKANFRDDVWTPVLQLAEVPYRPPYHCRHTMISHGLDQGLSAIEIAEIAGNTPRTIYQHYAASVKRIRVPRLLSGGGLP